MSLAVAKTCLRACGLDARAVYQNLSAASVRAAVAEQGLSGLVARLRDLVPDLRSQYTGAFDEAEYARYWEIKMRGLHAWQTTCALKALESFDRDGLVLADIGDSSGHHGRFIKGLAPAGKVARVISVNLDPVAVEKVRARGGEAVLCRAEALDTQQIRPDLFVSFETIEHLTDPVRFLHALAAEGSAEHLLMTVPYRRTSRFGGERLREPEATLPATLTAEDVHVYEFSADDWLLLAKFAGWRPLFTDVYLQYPRRSPLRITAPLWRRLDYEGFFAAFLTRDLGLARRYDAW